MKGLLVIVPCGQGKVWDRDPGKGGTPARDVYTGAPFKVNREYAEAFGECWIILSAKYGFISPGFAIPGPYNVTFKDKSTLPIAVAALRQQARDLNLDRFGTIISLGGKDYRAVVEEIFQGAASRLVFPFAGRRIGEAMGATKAAVRAGQPVPGAGHGS